MKVQAVDLVVWFFIYGIPLLLVIGIFQKMKQSRQALYERYGKEEAQLIIKRNRLIGLGGVIGGALLIAIPVAEANGLLGTGRVTVHYGAGLLGAAVALGGLIKLLGGGE